MTIFFIALVFVPAALISAQDVLPAMIFCPVCKSPDIFPVAGGYLGQVYLCKDCGYRGSFVLEADEKDDELKES
jgi:transposase-like protein